MPRDFERTGGLEEYFHFYFSKRARSFMSHLATAGSVRSLYVLSCGLDDATLVIV